LIHYLSAVNVTHPYIAEQIHGLLHHYDCVIVPELGGFVTDYRPAHIDKELNLIYPPSKELRFNNSLKKNDGLLANAIANAKEITHEEANALLKASVEEYFSQLNNGDRVLFEKVGVLYLDSHARLRFHPFQSVNFLLDSFRLKSIHARPSLTTPFKEPIQIEKDGEGISPIILLEPELEEPVLEEVEEVPLVAIEEPKDGRRYWIAASLLPFLFLAVYALMNTEALPEVKHQLSELNPFYDSVTVRYIERDGKTEYEPFETKKEKLGLTITLMDSDGPIVLREKGLEASAESLYVASPRPIELEYHVVGGCFAEMSNAEKLVKDLKGQGFDAYIFDMKDGLHRVVYGSYPNRLIALDALYAVKQEHQSDVWLLHKKH